MIMIENTDEQRGLPLNIDDAIRISKILCQAPEERIPMILSVLDKANVHINGLDDLEEWKAMKDQAYIIDMDDFLKELTKGSIEEQSEVLLTTKEFIEVCKRFNVKPSCAKRALHKKGYIKVTEYNGRLEYTVPVYVEKNKIERRIVILKKVWPKEVAADG